MMSSRVFREEHSRRVFDEGYNDSFLSEIERLVSFSTCAEDIPALKLARYGFGYRCGRLVECGFCSRIQVIETRSYTDAEIKRLHHPNCPIITGPNSVNTEFRSRESEDSDSDRALMYVVNTRAPAIRIRGVKKGLEKLDSEIIEAFLRIYPEDRLRSKIKEHFNENGLFPDKDMLSDRLERQRPRNDQ